MLSIGPPCLPGPDFIRCVPHPYLHYRDVHHQSGIDRARGASELLVEPVTPGDLRRHLRPGRHGPRHRLPRRRNRPSPRGFNSLPVRQRLRAPTPLRNPTFPSPSTILPPPPTESSSNSYTTPRGHSSIPTNLWRFYRTKSTMSQLQKAFQNSSGSPRWRSTVLNSISQRTRLLPPLLLDKIDHVSAQKVPFGQLSQSATLPGRKPAY